MKILESISAFLKSTKERTAGSPNTTLGGGAIGVIGAALLGWLEQQSGCKFQAVFANIDWPQLLMFAISTISGALTTDANKTITTQPVVVSTPNT